MEKPVGKSELEQPFVLVNRGAASRWVIEMKGMFHVELWDGVARLFHVERIRAVGQLATSFMGQGDPRRPKG